MPKATALTRLKVTSRKKAPPKKQVTKQHQNATHPFSWLRRHGNSVSKNFNGIDIITILGQCTSETQVLRILNRHSPVFSTAVFNLVEISLESLKVKCISADGTYDAEGTKVAKRLLTNLDEPTDALKGFNMNRSEQSLTATMLQEVILSGGVFAEAVLKDKVISNVAVVPLETIDFRENDKKVVPIQYGVDLNYPTMFYASLHQQATTYKASSMMSPAVGTILSFTDFVTSMEKSLDKSGHARLTVTLNKEMYINNAPDTCKDDPDSMIEWLEKNRELIATTVGALEPDDVLIMYDDQKAEILQGENTKADYSELLNTMAGILALSLKSHPAILGLRLEGSQSLSNIEALTYLHLAKGVQRPVAEIWSRVLTLHLRLLGIVSTVHVEFESINLRPDTELETHHLTRQTRHLQLLSLGMITDDEFRYKMDLPEPPADYVPLSGTGFMQVKGNVDSTGGASNAQDGGAEQTLNPDSKRNEVKKD